MTTIKQWEHTFLRLFVSTRECVWCTILHAHWIDGPVYIAWTIGRDAGFHVNDNIITKCFAFLFIALNIKWNRKPKNQNKNEIKIKCNLPSVWLSCAHDTDITDTMQLMNEQCNVCTHQRRIMRVSNHFETVGRFHPGTRFICIAFWYKRKYFALAFVELKTF